MVIRQLSLFAGLYLSLALSFVYSQEIKPKQKAQEYFSEGKKEFENENWSLSESYFDSCLQIDPEHFDAHFDRAISRENLQHFEDAILDYSAMIFLDPAFTEALWGRAVLYYRMGHYEMANEDFYNLLKIPEEETNAVYFSRRYPDKGVSAVSTLKTMRGQIFNYLGMTAHKLKQYQLAIEHFDNAIKLDSTNSDIYVNRSRAYENMGKYTSAINDLMRALQLEPENTLAKYNLARLQELNQSGNADILETYTSIINDNPAFSEAYAKRGLAKMNLGDLEGALKDYDSAIFYDNKDPLKWMNRGIIHMRLSFYEHAYKDLTQAINLKADMENAYLNRANVLMKFRKFEDAVKDYDIAIFYYPDFAMAYYNRGIAYYNLGEIGLACSDISKAAGMGFDQAEATMKKMCK